MIFYKISQYARTRVKFNFVEGLAVQIVAINIFFRTIINHADLCLYFAPIR
jgi:hypothetical protein